MTKKELGNWLINKFDSCYPVKYIHDNSRIYYYYDESYIRKKKLNKLNNIETISPSQIKGECLFILDTHYKILYCDNDNIWLFLTENHYSNTIREYMYRLIRTHDKLHNYIISNTHIKQFKFLGEEFKNNLIIL